MWVVPVVISNNLFGGADAEEDGGCTRPSGVVGLDQRGDDRLRFSLVFSCWYSVLV